MRKNKNSSINLWNKNILYLEYVFNEVERGTYTIKIK